MVLSERFDLIVFDFDGTLCDSAHVKTEAFRLLYLDEQGTDFADRVGAYHLANAGVSRYDKIRYIEREMLSSEASEERVQDVADAFGRIVEGRVIAAPLYGGVVEFLETYQTVVPLAVASATPTDELRRIIEAKGIGRYFAAVEGSPRSKGDILDTFLREFSVEAERTLMVGDQPSDVAAARQAGTLVAVVGPDQDSIEGQFPRLAGVGDLSDPGINW